jgi:hypothetical protein
LEFGILARVWEEEEDDQMHTKALGSRLAQFCGWLLYPSCEGLVADVPKACDESGTQQTLHVEKSLD